MPEILFKKQCGAFVPLAEYYEAYNSLKEGLVYKAKVTRPRNYKYHKMFFAFLTQLLDMVDGFNSIEHLRREVILQAGYYTEHITTSGNTIPVVDSMSFASMDQEAFEELSKKSVMVGLKILSKQINMTEAKRIDYENTLVKFFLD